MKRLTVIIAMLGIFLSVNAAPCSAACKDVTDKTFWKEVMLTSDMVVVEFYEDDNPDCKKMDELFVSISGEKYPETKFVRMNIKDCPKTVEQWGVKKCPTFLSIAVGYVIGKAEGVMCKEELKEKLGL